MDGLHIDVDGRKGVLRSIERSQLPWKKGLKLLAAGAAVWFILKALLGFSLFGRSASASRHNRFSNELREWPMYAYDANYKFRGPHGLWFKSYKDSWRFSKEAENWGDYVGQGKARRTVVANTPESFTMLGDYSFEDRLLRNGPLYRSRPALWDLDYANRTASIHHPASLAQEAHDSVVRMLTRTADKGNPDTLPRNFNSVARYWTDRRGVARGQSLEWSSGIVGSGAFLGPHVDMLKDVDAPIHQPPDLEQEFRYEQSVFGKDFERYDPFKDPYVPSYDIEPGDGHAFFDLKKDKKKGDKEAGAGSGDQEDLDEQDDSSPDADAVDGPAHGSHAKGKSAVGNAAADNAGDNTAAEDAAMDSDNANPGNAGNAGNAGKVRPNAVRDASGDDPVGADKEHDGIPDNAPNSKQREILDTLDSAASSATAAEAEPASNAKADAGANANTNTNTNTDADAPHKLMKRQAKYRKPPFPGVRNPARPHPAERDAMYDHILRWAWSFNGKDDEWQTNWLINHAKEWNYFDQLPARDQVRDAPLKKQALAGIWANIVGAQQGQGLKSALEVAVEQTVRSHPIVVFTHSDNVFCRKALRLLKDLHLGVKPLVIEVDARPDAHNLKDLLDRKTNHKDYPNIILGSRSIGGHDELVRLVHSGLMYTLLDYLDISYDKVHLKRPVSEPQDTRTTAA